MTPVAAVQARAPGKLVLLGEYAVIDGAPAWVAAVDRFAEVALTPAHGTPRLVAATDGRHEIPLSRAGSRWSAPEPWALAGAAYDAAFPDGTVDAAIDTSQFFLPLPGGGRGKAGYGSSAAVVAALLAASGRYAGDRERFKAAREVHYRAQGSVGSGIDIAAAVFGGTLEYRVASPQPYVSPLPLPQGLKIFAMWTGASASTPQLVGRVLEWKASAPAQYDSLMQAMHASASAGIAAARAGDVSGLLDALDDYGRRMAQLGRAAGAAIVTPEMEALSGKLAGLAACKPSGAGGGDIVLAFSAEGDAPAVQAILDGHGLPQVTLTFGAPGAQKR